MSNATEARLAALRMCINLNLDHIHDQAIRNFARLARSTGQYTRTDRATK